MTQRAVHDGGPYHAKEFNVGTDHVGAGSEIFVTEGCHVRHYYRTDGTRDALGRLVFAYDGPRETPRPTLPSRAWFTYRGRRHELTRLASTDEYGMVCPRCGCRAYLSHDPGGEHMLSVDAAGALTADPSVVCPGTGCTWHVRICVGTAVDV